MNYKQRFIDGPILKEFDMITGAFRRLQILDVSRNGLQDLIQQINDFNDNQKQEYHEEFHMCFPIDIYVDPLTSKTQVRYSDGIVVSDGNLRCSKKHPWNDQIFSNITYYINTAFNNIVIRALNDEHSSFQKYQTPFGILTYFNREPNGYFLGFERTFNNVIFERYNITKEQIKEIYHVDEINGDWPYGTEKQVFDLVDYINSTCFVNNKTYNKAYKIVQLKNKNYIAKFTDRTSYKAECDLLRAHPGSNKKGVFPEFEKKEDLENALKNLLI